MTSRVKLCHYKCSMGTYRIDITLKPCPDRSQRDNL